MSSFNYNQQAFSPIRIPVKLYAVLNFGDTGAVTLEAWDYAAGSYSAAPTTAVNPFSPAGTQAVATIVKTSASTGKYVLTLQQSFQRILSVIPTWYASDAQMATAIAAYGLPTPQVVVATDGTNVTTNSGGTIDIRTYGATLSTDTLQKYALVDPTSGMQLILEITLDDSQSV